MPLSSGQLGFILLDIIAINLMVIGFQGNLGVAFAIAFCPKYVVLDES